MSFLYLPLFCGLSNTLISAPADKVLHLPTTILWIVKFPWNLLHTILWIVKYSDICSSWECCSFTLHYFVDCQIPLYLLQLIKSFLYLSLFCGVSNSLISALAGKVLHLPPSNFWIVKFPDFSSS